MKTRIGISVGAFGAIIYFGALFGGYVAVLLLAGYVLLMEDDQWLRMTAVKAIMTLVVFSIIAALLNIIPDILNWISTLVQTFEGKFEYQKVSLIFSSLNQLLMIIKTAVMLILGAKAFEQGTITVPFVDRFLRKYL